MENLIYNILTILIVSAAVLIAAKKFYDSLKPKSESNCDSGCGGCSSKCDLKEALQNNNG